LGAHGRLARRRHARATAEIQAIALGQVQRRFLQAQGGGALERAAERVAAGELDPYSASEELLAAL
jgi:LAO/AO transport system kinase